MSYQAGRYVAAGAWAVITIPAFMLPIFLGVEWGLMNGLWALLFVAWAVAAMVGGAAMICRQIFKATEPR
jgi:hypothetical protein